MKICNKCKTEKSLKSFYFDKRPKRGFKSICKDCENTYKKMKREIDWILEHQPMSVFISAFKKTFGNHKNYTQEFIDVYVQNMKLQSVLKNKQSKCAISHNNLICYSCGKVQPLELPLSLNKLQLICTNFLQLHDKC